MKRYIRSSVEHVFGMAVVDKNEFGIPYDVWLDPAGNSRNVRHNLPRVKVVVEGKRIPFSISDDPKPLVRCDIKHVARICSWIRSNKDILLKHWNRELTDSEVLKCLVK